MAWSAEREVLNLAFDCPILVMVLSLRYPESFPRASYSTACGQPAAADDDVWPWRSSKAEAMSAGATDLHYWAVSIH